MATGQLNMVKSTINTQQLTNTETIAALDLDQLVIQIKTMAQALGFSEARICGTDLSAYQADFDAWLAKGYAADLDYMHNHRELRRHPEQLLPGTRSIITVRMDYLPQAEPMQAVLNNPKQAYISRYALGRDYHKLVRKRLTQLGQQLNELLGGLGFRAFVDSAPVMERQLAEMAGQGWRGKNSLLIHPQAGSWFFLAELFVDLDLPKDTPLGSEHCGSCQKCMDLCPTKAIVAEGVVDAGRCISYLTIENKGAIPLELRPLLGNRIYGCDDCQIVCPWTKFSAYTREQDFQPRHKLDQIELLSLFQWTEAEFDQQTQGSAIRRTGYQGFRRNLAVALGNAPFDPDIVAKLTLALREAEADNNDLLAEHLAWGLAQQQQKAAAG